MIFRSGNTFWIPVEGRNRIHLVGSLPAHENASVVSLEYQGSLTEMMAWGTEPTDQEEVLRIDGYHVVPHEHGCELRLRLTRVQQAAKA